MKNLTKKIVKQLSKINFNYKFERIFHDLKGTNVNKNVKYFDTKILIVDHVITIRCFIPKNTEQIIIYFHGGGFVVGNTKNYSQVCSDLANNTNSLVISVNYRLAPEYPFPCGLIDCYEVTKYLFSKDSFLDNKNIILMGDSAGGNIASVVSILASEKKEFKINKQILLYPLTYHIHNEQSKFKSIRENGNNYILTNDKINNYLNLYVKNKADLKSKYVAPLNAKELYNQPSTLIITANLDPLRDEGEAYGKKLQKFNNKVKVCRINALHGFFSLPFYNLEKCYKIINKFIKDGDKNAKKMV